jgi:hypothetical protein
LFYGYLCEAQPSNCIRVSVVVCTTGLDSMMDLMCGMRWSPTSGPELWPSLVAAHFQREGHTWQSAG